MSALDRTRRPPPGLERPFGFPHFERGRTTAGLEMIAFAQHRVPLVSLHYGHCGGSQFDLPGKRGLASFTAALVDKGTASRSATQLADEVEGRGGFLGAGCSWDGCSVGITVLSEHLEFAVAVLAEVINEAAFDQGEIERSRALRLAELERQDDDPSAMAARRFARAIYGERVYGSPQLGVASDIEQLSRSDVAGFWERHRQLDGSFLVAAGDFDPAILAAHLDRGLGGLGGHSAPPLPALDPSPLEGIRVHIVDRPGAAQCELRIGHLGVPRAHPDRPRLVLLNSLLGGKFTSRINLNLRERHGYTYGARSQFVDRRGAGPFVVSAAVDSRFVGAATREVLYELQRIREEAPSVAELEETRSYLLGSLPTTIQTLQSIAGRLELLLLYDLADDYYTRLPELFRQVTPTQILEAARLHLDPDRLAVVAVGPADELASQLHDLGALEVHEPENRPTAVLY